MGEMVEVAKKAAIEAGEVIQKLRSKKHKIRKKGDSYNVTTEADSESEELIFERLSKKFPNHNYWSEDFGKINNGSEYWWVIDPLDGTGPYIAGMPNFGVSIGLLKNGKPILGVINLPILNDIYWSESGKGAYKNGSRIFVSGNHKLNDVMIGYDFAWMDMREEELERLIKPLVGKVKYSPILGCTVAGLSYVAEGVYGAYIHWAYNWDFVAGAAIIQEARGKITDIKGEDINWLNDMMTVVASNGKIHEEILNLIKQ